MDVIEAPYDKSAEASLKCSASHCAQILAECRFDCADRSQTVLARFDHCFAGAAQGGMKFARR
jgi:hypothetical protein